MPATLWAVSDLHVTFEENRRRVDTLQPEHPDDWLIVAGDVAERIPLVVDTLAQLKARFKRVLWTPGNHELFNRSSDRVNGEARYRALVGELRAIGVDTPEDAFPVFDGVTVCPLFTLYDYSFRRLGLTAAQAVAQANVVLDDELAIAPYVDVIDWCARRLDYSRARLEQVTGPTVLVNHWPLVVEPTHRLIEPDIALWSGTTATRDWARRYRARLVVHGHLHIPAETRVDGVSHVDVSLGYPFEPRPTPRPWPFPVWRAHGRENPARPRR